MHERPPKQLAGRPLLTLRCLSPSAQFAGGTRRLLEVWTSRVIHTGVESNLPAGYPDPGNLLGDGSVDV